ncbi:MAG: hypothetical protein A3F90_04385 [Deltaproteobacteria bacterium RIFCSPLOWO2_12_FULL_60_19]|jgi:uncharacterized OsmC-like protein|nr:MAG: hypothetical protein A3F90_04385 [Deltaproteobacteria bacterium RIFCSPLOWO2_12_FULL_60_19]
MARLWSLLLLALCGCVSQSVMLIHPQSGATAKCGASGSGVMSGAAAGLVEDCRKKYESQGYVEVENLTREQRADLERRGLMPKPEPPTFRMGY